MYGRPTPRNTRVASIFLLAVALTALAVFFAPGAQHAQAQAPGVPRPDQTELMHLGFYLWWEESSGASGYDIQIRSQSDDDWGQWSAVSYSGTTQPAIVTGLTHLTKYQWRIRATADGQQSAWSTTLGNDRDTRTATLFSIDKPNPPILRDAVPGPGRVTLRWKAGPPSSGIVLSGYRISYRREDGQGVTTTRSTGPFGPDVTSADVTGLSAGVVYEFWVHPLVDGVGGASSRLLRATPLTAGQEQSEQAVLTGLGISGTVMRDGEAVSVWLFSNPWFDPTTASYTVRVPSDLQSISFAPSWTDDAITAVVLHERASAEHSTQGGNEAARTAASGARLTSGSNPRYPAVEVVAGDGDPLVHYFNLERVSLSFGGATVEDMTFTAGAEAPRRGLTQDEVLDLRLPKATGGFYNVTYTVTGLPAGLHLGRGRTIRGTPEAATTSPATVTYTATDETGASASLTFQVSVAPPLAFDAEQRQVFKDTIFEYTVGQAERIEAALPEATGGHGALTYHLTYRVRTATGSAQKSIDDDAPGFSFNAATRVLSSDIGASAPSAAAFYSVNYWVEDENGARAAASNSIAVNRAPTLRAIADQRFTVGESVSLTLPGAVGGTQVGTGILYRLEPAVGGLFFNGRQHLRSLTGTPYVPGTTEVTYTATDRNGVSATRIFAVTVVNGPAAPASAPSSLQAAQAYSGADPGGSGAAAVWDTVPGATGYVVQVRADGGSYPDLALESAPARVNLSLPNVDTGLVWINAISTGDYRVRVAARNAHGVGPWSEEVGFTVSAPQSQPQVGGQCDTCGTEGELGVVVRSKSPHAELIARMREWRDDPQWAHAKAHTDRWDRALLAFGESVSDTSLTAMTAAEAQGFADRGWERWVEVAAALRQIESGVRQAEPQQPPANQAPTVAAALADATIVHERGSKRVSLSGVFTDPDGDALTVSAASSDEAIATVSVASDGSSLAVTARRRGTATITVTATDGKGGTVSDAFTVTVKGAPVATAIGDVSGLEAAATREVSLAGAFSDPDGDALSVTAASGDEAVATVDVASDGSSLTLTGVAAGAATITVTARDADGNSVSEAFDISVVEAAGTETDEPETSAVVARYDVNGNGAIDIPEYLQALRDRAAGRLSEAEWEEILSAWLASAYR